jgi:UDP-N-acetyl-D-glucosamine dehydrogenase
MDENMESLITLIKNRKAKIGIVGLGYVGLPLTLRFSEENFKVIGFDIDSRKINSLNEGKSYIEHISHNLIEGALKKGFEATSDFSRIQETDAIILCVPTPLNKYREPDLSYVENTTRSIAPFMKRGQIICLESTTYPGTTDEVLKPILESISDLKVGKDFYLVYSPEREDPGRKDFSTKTTPKICGGITSNCLEMGMVLYGSIIEKVVPVSSTKVAEMTKLLENIHRSVNIGLVNEMKIVADKMGIDIHEVIAAAATKPFGFVPYFPGPGIGGHCIPIDPFYLTWKAREYGVHTRFIELAGEINNSMPDYVMDKVNFALNKSQISINGAKILVLGISYKKNVDDMRESPSVFIMEKLVKSGAHVDYSDPHVPAFPPMREHHFDLKSIEITPEKLQTYDCVLLTTDHDKFDYDLIKKFSKKIVDTRGKYKENHENIVRA